MIAGILLAAGSSRRYGSNKLLAEFRGAPLVCSAIESALNSDLDALYVVLGGPGGTDVRVAIESHFPRAGGIKIVNNQHASRGQMSSVKAALKALPDQAEAAVALLADMPLVSSLVINKILASYRSNNGVVVAEAGGRWRHPRLIPRRLFADFSRLEDNERGTKVLGRFKDSVVTVHFDDPELFADVDLPGDLPPGAPPES